MPDLYRCPVGCPPVPVDEPCAHEAEEIRAEIFECRGGDECRDCDRDPGFQPDGAPSEYDSDGKRRWKQAEAMVIPPAAVEPAAPAFDDDPQF